MRRHWQLLIAMPAAGCLLHCGFINPNTYTTPRTLNRGDLQMQAAPEVQWGSFTQTVPRPSGIGVTTQTTSFTAPLLPSVGARYGVSEGIELGGRLPNLTSLAVDGKIRLLKSRVDFAIDPGVQFFYDNVSSGTGPSGETITQSAGVFVFDAPVLVGINASESWSIVLSPRASYALATSQITQGDTSVQASGASSLLAGGGLGVDLRFIKKVAIHPQVTLLKGFGDVEPLLLMMGIGVNFGAQPDYSDLAEKPAAPEKAPKAKPEEGGT
jgi:hypothetical protein